jgi:hypothetical protein
MRKISVALLLLLTASLAFARGGAQQDGGGAKAQGPLLAFICKDLSQEWFVGTSTAMRANRHKCQYPLRAPQDLISPPPPIQLLQGALPEIQPRMASPVARDVSRKNLAEGGALTAGIIWPIIDL